MPFDDKDKLVILLAFTWAALIYFRRASSRLPPLPPGPKRLPLIGSLLNLPSTFEWETYARRGKEFSACLLLSNVKRTWRPALTGCIWIRFGYHLPRYHWHGGRCPEFA